MIEPKNILCAANCLVNFIVFIALYLEHTDHVVNGICNNLRVWAADHFKDLPNSYQINVDQDWHPRVLRPSYKLNISVIYDHGDGKWAYYPFGPNVSFIFGFKAKKFKEKVLKSDIKQLCIDAYNNYIECTFNSIDG